jgi:Ca-activated chloride channel family protein
MNRFLALMLIAVMPLVAQRPIIRAGVDLVIVPASVRDSKGVFIYGLMKEDFQIFEDGTPQEIRGFGVETLPLSVVLLIDTGMDGPSLGRVAAANRSLKGAFKDGDEVETYRFDHIVDKLFDFAPSPIDFEKKLATIKSIADRQTNRPTSVPILPGRGPSWLRRVLMLDAGIDYKDLNDPLYAEASDLATRPMERRKVIMIISDGQVADGATLFSKGKAVHTFAHTRDRLVQDQVQVYAISMGNALLEGPSSILHAYAEATGGEVYGGRTQDSLESAIASITEQARRQYVLTYVSNNENSGLLPVTRKIEVKATSQSPLTVSHRKSYLQYPRPK